MCIWFCSHSLLLSQSASAVSFSLTAHFFIFTYVTFIIAFNLFTHIRTLANNNSKFVRLFYQHKNRFIRMWNTLFSVVVVAVVQCSYILSLSMLQYEFVYSTQQPSYWLTRHLLQTFFWCWIEIKVETHSQNQNRIKIITINVNRQRRFFRWCINCCQFPKEMWRWWKPNKWTE